MQHIAGGLLLALGVFLDRGNLHAEPTAPSCQRLNSPPVRNAILAVWRSGANVVATGAKGAIVRSADGGATWNVLPRPLGVDLDRIIPVGTTDLYALGKDGGAISRDGGRTFTALALGEPREITAFFSSGNEVHIALCLGTGPSAGVMVRSTDRGQTFVTEPGGFEDCWTSIAALGEAGTFAIGRRGSIARYAGDGVWNIERDEPFMEGRFQVPLARLGHDAQGPFVVGQYDRPRRKIGHDTFQILVRRGMRDGHPAWTRATGSIPPSPAEATERPPRVADDSGPPERVGASSFLSTWERAPGDIIGVGWAGFGRSLDGGKSWTLQPASVPFVGVVSDGPHVTAVNAYWTLFRTDDDGRTWRIIPYGKSPETWVAAWGPSADDFYLIPSLDGRRLEHSTDGGRTWEKVQVSSDSGRSLRALVGVDTRSGRALYVVGWGATQTRAEGSVFFKPPGQDQFDVRQFPVPNPAGGGAFGVTGVSAASGPSGAIEVWACDTGGNALHSRDGGQSWTSTPVAPGRLTGITAAGPNEAYAVGDGGVFVRIKDGGATVQSRSTGIGARLNAVWANGRLIYTISQAGDVLRSTDGGETFTRVFNADASLNALSSDGHDGIWVVGDSGSILHCR